MAKSKNHTNHNQNRKAHRNGIKKPKKRVHIAMRGYVDPKFLRNLKYSRKGNKRPASAIDLHKPKLSMLEKQVRLRLIPLKTIFPPNPPKKMSRTKAKELRRRRQILTAQKLAQAKAGEKKKGQKGKAVKKDEAAKGKDKKKPLSKEKKTGGTPSKLKDPKAAAAASKDKKAAAKDKKAPAAAKDKKDPAAAKPKDKKPATATAKTQKPAPTKAKVEKPAAPKAAKKPATTSK